jgi:hypothetical protein
MGWWTPKPVKGESMAQSFIYLFTCIYLLFTRIYLFTYLFMYLCIYPLRQNAYILNSE